eukprot:Selendium_serpulae@DN1568_c0_g1_i1.p1
MMNRDPLSRPDFLHPPSGSSPLSTSPDRATEEFLNLEADPNARPPASVMMSSLPSASDPPAYAAPATAYGSARISCPPGGKPPLEFHTFSAPTGGPNVGGAHNVSLSDGFSDFGSTANSYLTGALSGKMGGDSASGGTASGGGSSGFFGTGWWWQLATYSPYFNVTTEAVVLRLKMGLTPWKSDSPMFWDSEMSSGLPAPSNAPRHAIGFDAAADLYGAVWVSTTLILALAISSNAAGLLQHKFASAAVEWHSEMSKLSMGFALVPAIALVLPLLIWGVNRYQGGRCGFLRLVSLMGYSLVPYVPAVVLCAQPYATLQLLALVAAGATACKFLHRNLKPVLEVSLSAAKMGLVSLAVLLCHGLVVLIFKFYYF